MKTFMSKLSQLGGLKELKIHSSNTFYGPLGVLTSCLDAAQDMKSLLRLDLNLPGEVLDMSGYALHLFLIRRLCYSWTDVAYYKYCINGSMSKTYLGLFTLLWSGWAKAFLLFIVHVKTKAALKLCTCAAHLSHACTNQVINGQVQQQSARNGDCILFIFGTPCSIAVCAKRLTVLYTSSWCTACL